MNTSYRVTFWRVLIVGTIVSATVVIIIAALSNQGPKIEIADGLIDLGMIDGLKRDVPGRTTFTIRNRGSEVLRLTKVYARCPCLKPRLDKDVLLPGEVAQLSVRVLVPDKTGEFRENIALSSNDPHNPVTNLMIKGIVYRHCDVFPKSVVVKNLHLGEERRVDLEIMGPVGDGLFVVQEVRSGSREIHFGKIEKTRTIAGSSRVVWTAAMTVTGRGEGVWEDTVVLSTSSDKAPSVEVPVTVRELPPVRASPAVAILRPNANGVTAGVEVEIAANASVPVRVSDIAKPDWLDLRIEPDVNSLPARLCLTAKSTSDTIDKTSGSEIVLTLQGELPKVKIPVLLLPAGGASLNAENRPSDDP